MRETRGGESVRECIYICMCVHVCVRWGVEGKRGTVLLESWLANESQRSGLEAQLQSKHACLLSGAQSRQPTWLATIDVRTNTR